MKCTAIYQNYGQIASFFGKDGADTLLGNAQTKLILGVSSGQTARFVSEDILGKQTLLYDPYMKQYAAATKRTELLKKALDEGNVAQLLPDIMHQHEALYAPDAVARPLMTPDEVMNMPADMGLLSISGLGIRPYQCRKIPYYKNKAVAGLYLCNPFIANDHITVPSWFGGSKTVPVISEPVPASISHLGQYQQGQWSYPKGFKPKLPAGRGLFSLR